MIQKVTGLIKGNAFASATIWMTVGMMFANIGAFLFVFLLVRILTPQDYAVFSALMSIFNLLLVPAGILQLTVVRFVAQAKGTADLGQISYIYHFFFKKILVFGVILLIAAVLFAKYINAFLHIPQQSYIYIILVSAIGFYFIIIARAVMQGVSAFRLYSVSTILEMVFKVLLAGVLVGVGLSLYGAMTSILLSEVIVMVWSIYIVQKRFIRKDKQTTIQFREILSIGVPATFILLGVTSFYTTDILLVKHYFPENVFGDQASLYAGVATLGKVIFFGTAGIASALLPIATERHTKGESTTHLLLAGLGLVALGSTCVTGIYFLFPQYALMLLGKPEYLTAHRELGLFAIYISIHSLVFLLANFFLSIKEFFSAYIIAFFALAQIGGIILFHTSLIEIILVSIVVSTLLFVSLLLLYVVRLRLTGETTSDVVNHKIS